MDKKPPDPNELEGQCVLKDSTQNNSISGPYPEGMPCIHIHLRYVTYSFDKSLNRAENAKE